MENLFENLVITRSLKAIAAVFAVAAIAVAPGLARAAEQNIKFRGQDIWVDGAELKWIGSPTAGDAELLLIYKGSTGTFRTSNNVEARVLAIGGGGAGGTVRKADQTKHPGGGGGGAGELVDRNNVSLLAGDAYQLTIGAGGQPQGSDTDAQPGANGEDSVIARGGTDFLRVKGGGGGGGETVGQPGGSGGGGSNDGATGGESVKINADGQGNKGGTSGKRYAAGGGGAGAAGGDGSTASTGGNGGNGGAGVESDIDPDNIRYYAGGGGGGDTNSGTPGAGGVGGGGKGGTHLNTDSAVSTPGEDNTGSGGGGGGRYKPGSAGGSGIIIIRLTYIDVPLVWKSIDLFDNGKIFVTEGVEYTRVNPSDPHSDVIIKYTNPDVRGGLRFFDPENPSLPAVWANARVLVVGGGGGGGFDDERRRGGGAGGGAGGFVETGTDGKLVFSTNFEYAVEVGKGGVGGNRNNMPGGSGGNSVVKTTAGVIGEAFGGGGGGVRSAGLDGGSGGGGSQAEDSSAHDGGSGIPGQGFAGGRGVGTFSGGGGGGAGGAGGDSETFIGGVGGLGRQCDITGENLWYAAGGGGAVINAAQSRTWYLGAKGGSGIGGDGAGAKGSAESGASDAVAIPATPGVDGTGSGGGGGTSYVGCTIPAGKGGDGIVIIRLSGFVVGSVPVPGEKRGDKYYGPTFTYDGTWHVGVADFFAYTFKTSKTERTTWPVAIDADNYVVTVNIAPGAPYTWADWKEGDPEEKKWGDRTIYWRINRREVEVPEVTESFVYDATEHFAVDKDKLHLDDDGYCYTDEGLKYCLLTATHRATNVKEGPRPGGWYTFDAQLFTTTDANGQSVTNFVWDTGAIADVNYHWRITQAPNAILNFTYDSYKLSRIDTPAKAHYPTKHFDASWGKGTAVIEYRPVSGEGGGEGEGWMAWPPTEKGSYELRVTVPECDNWAKATATLPFGTWNELSDLFSDQMPVTAQKAGTALEDFPVPVRIHEPTKDGYSEMSGFSYLRAGLDGTAIQFFDSNEDPIPHEVELWNIRGESVVWVRLPKVSTTATTKFTMCWRRVSDIYLKPYDGGAVWRDTYTGVWHMSRLEEGRIPDATGNGGDAYFTGDAQWEFIDGKKGAPMGNGVYLKSGDLLVDDGYPYKPGTITNRFTYTGWYRNPDYRSGTTITTGYKMFAGTKVGATSTTEMQTLAGWALRLNNNLYKVNWQTTGQNWEWNWGDKYWNVQTTWGYLGYKAGYIDAIKAPTTNAQGVVSYYGRGIDRFYAFADTINESATEGVAYYVNGSDRPLQLATGGFYVDEVRLSTNAFSKARLQEEYNTLHKADYCENGLVSIDCDRYNDGKGLVCDWWVTVPSLSTTMWKAGETPATVSKGTYKGASAAINAIYTNLKTGEVTTNDTSTTLKNKPVGYYRATFDHSSPANYRPQAHSIDFYIIEKVDPMKDLGGSESGRVLIMNADNNAAGPVTNQGWCATEELGGVTYWRTPPAGTGPEAGVVSNNVLPGTSFDLVRRADEKVLWHLEECRQGNTFTTNNLLLKGQNYLPASVAANALSVTNENVKATTKGDAGWLMLRNRADAAVTSGVFTNGVGTIYFDAVNQRAVASENYKLVVEVATAATAAELEDLDAIGEDSWKAKDMYALWYQNTTGTASQDLDATKELALVETHGATAASEGFFYRVHAPVLEHRPTRVRIRRTAFDDASEPDEAMILMDNLIVSIPPTSAELVPYGKLNTSLKGVQVVGQGGAFVPPFPSAGAAAPKGRARVVLPAGCAYAGQSPDSYLSLAQMFYRRRYLGQLEGSGEWQVAIMEGAGAEAVETLEPLGVAMEPGDIEFKFTAVMKSPYYGYVDYSNKINTKDKVTQKGDWTEEKALKESQYESPDPDLRLGSLGEDWFVRIRRAASDWERTEVELHGAIEGLYPMELMDDGTWRAVVRIPVDAAEGADCTFKFNGWNRQTPGATEYASNRSSWGGGGTVEELPNNGVLSETGEPTAFKLDHRSGYLEFRIRIEGDSKIWSIARAEYQDFNSWNDAHTTDDLFHVNDVQTNGVDDVNMTSKTNNWSKYALFEASNDAWNETFYTADYSKDFPLDVVYDQAPKMPNGYYKGRYISFVHSKLAAQNKEATEAGLAGKLLGQGKGTIDFLGTGTVSPDGIDEITFQARVGQSASFDGIGYDLAGMFGEGYLPRANYMFFAQSTMSEACDTGGATLGDMAVGASISLVGYYIPYQGCYEIRVERPYSGAEYTMKLCKWRNVNGVMTCETLASTRFYNPASYAWTDEASTKGDAVKGRFGFFISCETMPDGSTQVVGGLSKAAKGPDTTYPARAYSGGNFNGLVVIDKDSNFTWGSYGVMSKDCPSQFLLPIVFHAPLQTLPTKTQIVANKSWYFSNQPVTLNGADDATKFDSCATGIKGGYQWALPTAKRLEEYEAPGSADWIGLRAPTNLAQTAIVQIRKQGGGDADWTTVMETPVSSYAFEPKKLVLHRTGRWDVRYTTGEQAIDVVFTDIRQTRWHAADDADIDVHNEDFTYTQALLETNKVSRRRELVLQPARADASKPVSLRSPMLNGLGKLTFSYTHADADAQIWVQIATNNVSGSTLGGAGGYNQSIREGEGEGEWITVRKFGPYAAGCDEELGEKGVRTVYLGFHDDGTAERPHKGVMRLWVPTAVVKEAVDLATNATKVTSHGQVTVTGVQATDEPKLSERSWRGWNMRTAGDAADGERRMYLSDATLANDLGYGLVGALNNTADPATIVETEDETKARACLPTIFSPTFGAEGGGRTGIGAVSFKARVYERPGETAPAGRITVWGASDNTGANWTVIGTNEVVSTVFTNFTWATGGSYSAIKIELSSPGYRKGEIDTGRVILDEILISEKVQPSVTFDYARPFRMNLASHSEILDIMSPDEQPLAGESWGVQTKLTLKQLEKEVDVERGFKVYLSYYRGEAPWGYEQWKDRGDAVVRQELELVGDASNLVFRSNIAAPQTLVPPAAAGNQTVQFMLEAEYSTGAGKAEKQMLTRGMWKQPEWYYPVDKNAAHGGDRDETKFAAYSIIDTVSPGRAWINEVNWNDGMKSETGGTLSKTNQYVEVCVPAGVDMTGWWVQLTGVATDPETGGKKTGKLFTFGKWGVPKSKNTGRAVNGYEFMFVQSPDTADRGDGGVKDRFGNPADGTWSDGDQVGMTRGTLVYYLPYQFELYRPSGVLEHQFVLEGTNTATLLSGSMYSGTNLVAELNQFEIGRQGFASPKRFYAGEEKARRKDGALYGSAGVVRTGIDNGEAASSPLANGEAASSPLQHGPGSDGTWDTGLQFTPGELNEGQVIPPGWFLPPNGTNSWVYASVVGDHLHQKVGDDTGRSILIIVPQGGKTNIHYTVDNFYELDSLAVNGVTNAAPRHVPHVCDYEINSPTGTVYVVATEGVDDRLLRNWGLGPKNPFTPSILNWLGANWPDKDVDDMVPAHYQMVDNNAAAKHELGLNDMYWLDIPPFTASGEPEWLLRAGVKGMEYPVVRNMHNRAYTNLILTVKMYVENDHTFETNRVVKMQGLDDSRSNDPDTYDVWNSQTFKIRGALKMSDKFLPFRTFIFDGGSFDANHTSKVEIMDPWSPASPGYSYGWDLHPENKNSSFWCTTMDTDAQPVTIETLKADSTY